MIQTPAGFNGADRIKRYQDYYQAGYGVTMLSAGQFSPLSLFAAGEQGAWFDPSDFTTLFQDDAGTIPVTAVEQTVGRMLDKSGRGNHASQATSGSRPIVSARYNILTGSETLSTQTVATQATNYTLRFSGAGSITLSGTGSGTYSAGINTVTCSGGSLTVTVTGAVTSADLRATNDGVGLPVYQRVTTSTDYDTVNFPLYLRFDGSNDSLATASIDFSGTNKMSLFAGIRKLSDAAQALVVELGAPAATGAFTMQAPSATPATNKYLYTQGGTAALAVPFITGVRMLRRKRVCLPGTVISPPT